MKRYLLVFVVLMTVSFGLYAGGTNQPSGGAGADSNTASFMWWGDENRHAATQKAIAEFEKANPGKKITALPNPFDGYHDKIIMQLSNNAAPDLFCYSTEWMSEVGYAKNPVLKDLNELSAVIDFSTFNKTLLAGGSVNGKQLGIPTGISGWTFVYDKKIYNEFVGKSGRSLPPAPGEKWTVEDLISYAQAFKQTMGADRALIATADTELAYFIVYMASERAGKYYVSDRAELQVSEQDIVETFKLFTRFTEAGVLPAPALQVESLGDTTVTDMNHSTGKWVGSFCWTSNIPEFARRHQISVDDVGIMAYPIMGRPEFDGLFIRPAQFWSIASASKNQKTAAELLNFIANDPAAIAALEMQRSVPPTDKGQKVLADLGILIGPVYTSTQYLLQSAGAPYTPFILIPELMDTLRNNYSSFIMGRATAEAAGKAVYNDWQRMLTNIRRINGL
jgi:oligogalacturonide transport system substrate-binding protein